MKSFKNVLFRVSHWETWHYLVKYVPIMPAWLWYCLKARSFWFFTPSNPTLTFGGFEGEGKKEMYDQLPPGSYPKSVYIHPFSSFEEVKNLVERNDFKYPFAVKPDVGMMGLMFRKINTLGDLMSYHQKMQVTYIVQDFIDYPVEVSVFYYRFPGCTNGTITGFLKKEFLQVTGDGAATLWQLMTAHSRVRFRLPEMKSKHEGKLNIIIPAGEVYLLSNALNLSRGGKLISLADENDEALVKVFDKLSNYSKHFYYGRYDIKCASIKDLKEGKNFSVLEYNGCGAEPHHIYGNGNTLFKAYAIVLHHWKVLYKISRYNHKNGSPCWEFKRGLTFLRRAKKHFKVLRQLDMA